MLFKKNDTSSRELEKDKALTNLTYLSHCMSFALDRCVAAKNFYEILPMGADKEKAKNEFEEAQRNLVDRIAIFDTERSKVLAGFQIPDDNYDTSHEILIHKLERWRIVNGI